MHEARCLLEANRLIHSLLARKRSIAPRAAQLKKDCRRHFDTSCVEIAEKKIGKKKFKLNAFDNDTAKHFCAKCSESNDLKRELLMIRKELPKLRKKREPMTMALGRIRLRVKQHIGLDCWEKRVAYGVFRVAIEDLLSDQHFLDAVEFLNSDLGLTGKAGVEKDWIKRLFKKFNLDWVFDEAERMKKERANNSIDAAATAANEFAEGL